MQTYLIRYAIQKEDGYWDFSCEEEVHIYSGGHGKNLHTKAEKIFKEKYKGKKFYIKSIIYV